MDITTYLTNLFDYVERHLQKQSKYHVEGISSDYHLLAGIIIFQNINDLKLFKIVFEFIDKRNATLIHTHNLYRQHTVREELPQESLEIYLPQRRRKIKTFTSLLKEYKGLIPKIVNNLTCNWVCCVDKDCHRIYLRQNKYTYLADKKDTLVRLLQPAEDSLWRYFRQIYNISDDVYILQTWYSGNLWIYMVVKPQYYQQVEEMFGLQVKKNLLSEEETFSINK